MRNDIGIGRLNGAVAQLVEQRTENPCVGGSIPPHTTKTSAAMLGFFVFKRFNNFLDIDHYLADKGLVGGD